MHEVEDMALHIRLMGQVLRGGVDKHIPFRVVHPLRWKRVLCRCGVGVPLTARQGPVPSESVVKKSKGNGPAEGSSLCFFLRARIFSSNAMV